LNHFSSFFNFINNSEFLLFPFVKDVVSYPKSKSLLFQISFNQQKSKLNLRFKGKTKGYEVLIQEYPKLSTSKNNFISK
jgi:hypothetical protein